MEKIITNLWFDDEAEEAANFYTSIFKNSRVIATTLFRNRPRRSRARGLDP